MSSCCHSSPDSTGLENPSLLDAFAHDTERDVLILAMFELRPWDLGELQLFQLQEKLNAYLSFVLDGEMQETFPHLQDKPVHIELRTLQEPPAEALAFIERVREQLTHQKISFEVVLIEEQLEGGCGCHDHEVSEKKSSEKKECCQSKKQTETPHRRHHCGCSSQ